MTQTNQKRPWTNISFGSMAVFASLAVAVGASLFVQGSSAGSAAALPAPVLDPAPADAPTSMVAVLAGGCFWGVQGVFQHVKGVSNAVSGYAGGEEKTAHYQIVGSGMTGHAESVEVTFDPHQISYARI